MNERTNRLVQYFLTAVLGIVLVGCATAPTATTPSKSTEDSLVEAGFQMRTVDTPQKLAKLQALPQRQLVWQQRKGMTRYVFADANAKRIYVGDVGAFERFWHLVVKEKIVDHKKLTSPEQNPEFWDMWEDLYGGR